MDGKGAVERSSRKGIVAVLGTVLVAVGVILVSAGVVVETNSEPAPIAVSGAGTAPPAVAPSHEPDEQMPDLAVREAAPVCEAIVPMRVRVKRRLGQSSTHYTGPLVVEVAGRVLVSTTLVNRDALALEVPANASSLRFIAPDHVPLEASLPLQARGKEPIVELQPDALLAVCSLGLPLEEEASVRFSVDAVSGWSRTGNIREDKGAFEAPCAVGEEFQWWAALDSRTRRVSLRGREPALQRGERRVLTLDFASVPMQRYRVVGPSPELMAELFVYRPSHAGSGDLLSMRLDSSGCFEFPRDGGGKWCVQAGEGEVELAEEKDAETIVLRPSVPLLGLGLRVVDAPTRQTLAFDANGKLVSGLASLHVFAREQLPPTLYLGSKFAGSVAVPCDRLPNDDVVWIDPSAAPAPGRLMLRLQGAPPAADVASKLWIQVQAPSQEPLQQVAAAEMQLEVPPDVSFGLRWALPDGPGPWIARDLRVASGATHELTAEWPVAHRWTGEVEKFAAMPLERRWHRISWGDGPSLFGRGMRRLGDDGRFELFLFAEDTLDPVWRLFWGLTTVPAQAEVADPGRHHLVVRPLVEVRWVNVIVDAKPPWMVFVWSTLQPRLRPGSWHNEQRPIPVLAGEVRHGGLLRGDELLAWFRIDAQGDSVHVQPAGGRTIELRPRAACGNRMVCLVGPGGQWDMGHELSSSSPLRVFAPDGTVGIAVFDGNRQEEPTREGLKPGGAVREIPLGTDDVIVID